MKMKRAGTPYSVSSLIQVSGIAGTAVVRSMAKTSGRLRKYCTISDGVRGQFRVRLKDWLDHSIGTVRASVECKNVPGLFGWLSAPRGRPRAYDLLVLTSATYTWFGLIWFNTLSKTIRHRTDARSSHRCRPGRRLGRRAIARARCAPPPRPARVGPS